MDLPLRTKLLTWFIAVALVGGVLTVVAGSVLINQAVSGEAQRRAGVGLRTARAILQERLSGARKAAVLAAKVAGQQPHGATHALLVALQEQSRFDYVQAVDARGVVVDADHADAIGQPATETPLLRAALSRRQAGSGLRLAGLGELVRDGQDLVDQARVQQVPTERARARADGVLQSALVLEGVAPVVGGDGTISGAVRVGMLLTRNNGFVDFIRENIFTVATYRGKNLGIVTVTQGDVRVATNAGGAGGGRAVGTAVSAEVAERVLAEGKTWEGTAFVVDSWYVTAYEPLRGVAGGSIGMLGVGVLKDRYDDLRRQAMRVFVGIAALALLIAFGVATWRAEKIAGPLSDLTDGVVAVARGDLSFRLPSPSLGTRDEVRRLTAAFIEMVEALKRRDMDLRASRDQLEDAANELRRWNRSYQEALAFITHELKNQVAAMKINLLALRDGYVGALSEDQQEAVGDIADAIERTEDMISNYLNLSRIEKGDLDVRARPVQIEADVIRVVLWDLRLRFEEKRMRVEVDLADDLVVQADPALLQVVCENLLSNAAKYGRPNGRVRVWGRHSGDCVELHVWNEGDGVPVEKREELFQKFSRLHTQGSYERGTGLGLFITREIVLKLGGRIWAESEYGQWADFVVTLPRPDMVLGADAGMDE